MRSARFEKENIDQPNGHSVKNWQQSGPQTRTFGTVLDSNQTFKEKLIAGKGSANSRSDIRSRTKTNYISQKLSQFEIYEVEKTFNDGSSLKSFSDQATEKVDFSNLLSPSEFSKQLIAPPCSNIIIDDDEEYPTEITNGRIDFEEALDSSEDPEVLICDFL